MQYFISTRKIKGLNYCNIEQLIDWLKATTEISVDTETEGLFDFKNKVNTLQLGNYDTQFIIDVTTIDISSFRKYLEDPRKLFLFWNSSFDLKFLRTLDIYIENVYDGFLAEAILTTGFDPDKRNLSLKDATKKYCNVELDKSVRAGWTFNKEGIEYAGNDVKYLGIIKTIQLEAIRRYELEEVLNLENNAVHAFVDMEFNGFKLNTDKWSGIADVTQKRVIEYESLLDDTIVKFLPKYYSNGIQIDIFGKVGRITNINWSSPEQVLKILKELGLFIDSTNTQFLLPLQKEHEIIIPLLKYRKAKKLNDAFGLKFLNYVNPITKRLHPNFFQILSTGRVSCNKPNLLQIPSKGDLASSIRECFIAQDGYKIVGGDYSGCELRIIAQGSKDPVWTKEFKGEGKVHDKVACMMFNIEMDKVREKPEFLNGSSYRDVAKTIDFGWRKRA